MEEIKEKEQTIQQDLQDELIENARVYSSHTIADFPKVKYEQGEEITVNGENKTVCPPFVPNNFTKEYYMEKAQKIREAMGNQFSLNLDMLSYTWAPQWYKFGTMGAEASGICQNNYFRDEEFTLQQNVLGEKVNFIS